MIWDIWWAEGEPLFIGFFLTLELYKVAFTNKYKDRIHYYFWARRKFVDIRAFVKNLAISFVVSSSGSHAEKSCLCQIMKKKTADHLLRKAIRIVCWRKQLILCWWKLSAINAEESCMNRLLEKAVNYLHRWAQNR